MSKREFVRQVIADLRRSGSEPCVAEVVWTCVSRLERLAWARGERPTIVPPHPQFVGALLREAP